MAKRLTGRDRERLKRIEAIAFWMTNSARPVAESRRIARFAAAIAYDTLREQIERAEQLAARDK